jgi:hypothetical protein
VVGGTSISKRLRLIESDFLSIIPHYDVTYAINMGYKGKSDKRRRKKDKGLEKKDWREKGGAHHRHQIIC